MHELGTAIPDPDAVIALAPEELGAKLLFLLRARVEREHREINPQNCIIEVQNAHPDARGSYPQGRRREVAEAVSEAFAWLEAQGLLVPAPGQHGEWKILSRRARQFEDERQFLQFATARQLPKDLLHPALSERVWLAFMRGEFDTAVFQAMKAVEIAVRDAARFSVGDHGVPMIRTAFHPERGPLRDPAQEAGEREALMHLFSGAVGSYKNPHSHRNVPIDDPAEAIEIIMLANHLLRIVDARQELRPEG